MRVLNSLAQALNLSAEVLLDQAGLLRDIRAGDLTDADPAAAHPPGSAARLRRLRPVPTAAAPSAEAAIRADDRLSAAQKHALLAVYRSYVSADSAARDG